MATKVNIFHKPANQDWADVTPFVMKDGFPDAFTETLKGEGLNEYRVKEFTFNLHKASFGDAFTWPERLDFVKIEEANSGIPLLNGFVDEIRKEYSDTPEFTVFPNALLLKDTLVGEVTEDEGEEPITEFKLMDSPKPLHEIVGEVCTSVNNKRGTNFTADEDSVPTTESDIKNFFGNTIFKMRQFGFINFLFEVIFGEDKIEIRKQSASNYPSGYRYTALRYDVGLFIKTVISYGAFLNWAWSHYWGWPFNWTISISLVVPWFDFKLPTMGAYIFAYDCTGGGVGDIQATHEFFPLAPFHDTWPSLHGYGTKVNNGDFTNLGNIGQNKIWSYLKREGWENPIIKLAWDYDSTNTYWVAEAKNPTDLFGYWLIFGSMETPFDNEYRLHYRNKNGSDILKDLAIVSNRWFYVDPLDKIHLLPRNDANNTKQVISSNFLERERETEKNKESEVSVSRYEKDSSSGKVSTYGLVLRKNELDAIVQQYSLYAQSTRQEYNIKLYDPPTGDDRIALMDEIVVTADGNTGDYSIGRVIELEQSFLDNTVSFKTEVSDDFTLMEYTEEQEEGEGPNPSDPSVEIYLPQPNTQHTWAFGGELYITWEYFGDGWPSSQSSVWVELKLQQEMGPTFVTVAIIAYDLHPPTNVYSSSLTDEVYDGVNKNAGYEDYRIKLSVYWAGQSPIIAYRNIVILDN